MNSKKIIIIGSGITGMSVGCYLQMNGYQTEIYEKEPKVGGLCTSWKKGGYTFDDGLTWLVGSGERHIFNKFWKELGVIPTIKFEHDEVYAKVYLKDGTEFNLYSNAEKLRDEFIRFAPEDEELINRIYSAIKVISNSNLNLEKSPELFTYEDFQVFKETAGPYMKTVKEWEIKIKDFAQSFKSQFIRENFKRIFWFNPDTYMAYFILTLAWCDMGSCGYPLNSSIELSEAIQRRYEQLGGKVYLKSPVEEIVVDNNQASGIKIKKGEYKQADLVISACDGYTTIYKMLNGRFVDDDIRFIYDNLKPTQAKIKINLGLDVDRKDMPRYFNLSFSNTIKTSLDIEIDNFQVNTYSNQTFVKNGTSSLTVTINTDYFYWRNLYLNDKKLYRVEKQRIADEVIHVLDSKFRNVDNHIEVIDVATPVTFERYTNNYKGATLGWEKEEHSFINEKKIRKELPNLDNFFMVGHWTLVGGGLPSVMLQARNLAQLICAKDKKVFSAVIS
ncbi:phytoene desaturase family protein [Lactococcus lactis]|uniref:FAD-dependent oxidoreductase n=1 Tax=Lactococcus lactis TaxID=1358 RepID=A0AAE4NNB3_9LACT|nr:FAD-dependent oxidoreductase [Lactococcus lactis]ATY87707.1 NAD(P)/FAD-dependent oxidoreductase [Lactococcus lactis subsp. lactis]ATZ01254.1 NAD(P)/FAD-dependent oxidoreductase [Lactococcus lactis subsp. lactis]KST97550.1 Carotenoid cis-trans isomerase [Lactococcus lactis subsp. lactis]KST99653.1 Carotenoid cis-trans isomerase [Lactococcus lactis subsp. lactis]KSU08692.1 Carotenoid cis-trans isomerase [Lactococcus lactis subsp. lactis]